MEQKIGEIFEYNGEWYQCVKGVDTTNCSDCDIQRYCITVKPENIGRCLQWRSDKKKAIFKKLEKVGKPFELLIGTNKRVLMQEYRIYGNMYIWNNDDVLYTDSFNGIKIEIKENKENMEEKKLNLKPFDLQKAKEGKPVCTRDGRKARIICFDYKSSDDYSMIALVDTGDNEIPYKYTKEGKFKPNCTDAYDLMMLPEKKEIWINVYKERCYESKEEAIRHIAPGKHYIDTIRVEWEE